MHNHNNTNTFKFHELSLVSMNNLLVNKANSVQMSVCSQSIQRYVLNLKNNYYERLSSVFIGRICYPKHNVVYKQKIKIQHCLKLMHSSPL
jgi:hypothetical protein